MNLDDTLALEVSRLKSSGIGRELHAGEERRHRVITHLLLRCAVR
jgi:hypothetical protein